MILISLLITFLVGLCTLAAISKEFSYLEKLGSMFLVGMSIQVFWMILLDFVGIPIALPSIYVGSLIYIVAMLAYMIKQQKHTLKDIFYPTPIQLPKNWQKINIPWLVVAGLALNIWWWVTQKCFFFPTFDFDAIAGYDLMAKVLASENTFNNSLFYSDGKSMPAAAHRLIYPPLVAGSFSYAYMSGLALSKIMTTLFHTSGLVLIYGLSRKIGLTALNAMCIILGILYIPELTAHASLSQTNLPQAMYTTTGFLALYVWFIDKEKNRPYLWVSMLLLSGNCIVRVENIVFGFMAGVVVLVDFLKHRDKKHLVQTVTYGVVILFPLILWNIYLKINGLSVGLAEGPSVLLFYDAEKFAEWWGFAWGGNKEVVGGIARSSNYYGMTTNIFMYMLIVSSVVVAFVYLRGRVKEPVKVKKILFDHLYWVWMSLICFMVYTFFFYFIDYNWDSMRNVMMYSYKRGLFAVMILFVFFTFGNHASQTVFKWIERFLYPESKLK